MPAPLPGAEPGYELLAQLRPHVRHCGDTRRAAWHIPARCLLDYLVVAIADGKGRFTIGKESWDARAGDVFWIPPATPHEMRGDAPGQSVAYLHLDLQYRPDLSHWDFSIPGGTTDLSAFGPLMHPKLDHPLLTQLTGRHNGHAARRAGDVVRAICLEAARAQPFAGLRMSGLAMELIVELLRGRTALADGNAHLPLLEQAADRLRRLGKRAAVGDLAATAGLSPSHFRTLFTRYFGQSPRDYGRQARLRRAKELMIASSITLADIARRVGFANVHAFSKAFRNHEGMNPSEYRRCGNSPSIRVEGRRVPYPY